jgi:hypothetical protein
MKPGISGGWGVGDWVRLIEKASANGWLNRVGLKKDPSSNNNPQTLNFKPQRLSLQQDSPNLKL